MKVLVATGIEKLDEHLLKLLPENDMEAFGQCFHRNVLQKVIDETGANTLVVSPALSGDNDLIFLIRAIREKGTRVIVLPGSLSLPQTLELVKALVPYGIYDFVYDKVRPQDVITRLKNPGNLGEVAKSFAEAFMDDNRDDDRSKNILAEMVENLKQKYRSVITNKAKNIEKNDLFTAANPKHEIEDTREPKTITEEKITQPIPYQPEQDNSIDYLTGCFMRSALDGHLNKLSGGTYSILFCDLDNFKMVNDTYGHAAGDEILKLFGEHLLMSTRRSDYVYRYGGDEFVIVFSDTDIDGAYKISQKIAIAWNQKKFSVIDNKQILFSGGLAHNAHGNVPEEVLKAADEALYRVKRSGRGRVDVAFKGRKRKKAINIPQDPRVLICADAMETLFNYIQSANNLTVIDADFDSNLAYKLNIPPDELWKHDWRIGLSVAPASVGRKVNYYGMDKGAEKVFEDRDIRSLKDIINNRDAKQIIVYLGAQQGIEHHFFKDGFTILK